MSPIHKLLVGALCLTAAFGCTRASETSPSGAAGKGESTFQGDVKDLGKATEKAAKDLGHATVDLADKAGEGLKDVTNKAGTGGEDAWITTKVKSELTSEGFDPVHVHVDTAGKVVTLSGTVESAAKKEQAVRLAKAVSGVSGVQDHLFVKHAEH